jgi:hypothetical protein
MHVKQVFGMTRIFENIVFFIAVAGGRRGAQVKI